MKRGFRYFLRKVHCMWVMICLLVIFLVHYPFFWIFSRSRKYYKQLNIARKSCSRSFMFLSGIWVKIEYETPLDPGTAYIFCPNHTSYLDIPLMCLAAGGSFHFMGKDDLLKNPLFSIFFRTIDIPVKRESKIASFRAFKRCADNLAEGMPLILFPEGTITMDPPCMGSFKNGAFRLAIESGMPVVPVSITNVWKILYDEGQDGSRPGIIRIFVHRPIRTEGLSQQDDNWLKEQTFSLIQEKIGAGCW